MKKLQGTTAIVTGASAGLGRAIVTALAAAGVHVGLIAREETALRRTAEEIAQKYPVKTAFAAADTAQADKLAQAAALLITSLGSCDIWVNNAMETVFSPFDALTAEEFRRVTEVDYLGFVHGTQEALNFMRRRDSGHIIQIGSALAYRSIPLQSAYCGAKAAIRAFTDSVRTELIHDKSDIHLTCVHMPALNTPQFSWARTHVDHQPRPVGEIFQPELGAEAVVHAIRHPRREYWVGGSTIAAILGTMLFPGWMDRKMAAMCYEQQLMQNKPMPPREGNLAEPYDAPGHRIHGIFDKDAKRCSFSWTVVKALSRLGL